MNPLFLLAFVPGMLFSGQIINITEKEDQILPLEMILAVDISLSMSREFEFEGKIRDPNDPKGTRWDGIQFAIDSAKDADRVSLVVFRGTPVFLTRFLDNTGYVTLGKIYDDPIKPGEKTNGRNLLKELVQEIQHLERQFARDFKQSREDPELREKNGVSKRMADFEAGLPVSFFKNKGSTKMLLGTSNVLCLKAIASSDLIPNHSDPSKNRFLFLFTDGQDEPPVGNLEKLIIPNDLAFPVSSRDFEYANKRKEVKAGDLRNWVAGLIDFKPFQNSIMPVIGFGLGKFCDDELLRTIAYLARETAGESKRANERLGSYYPSKDAVELLTLMQDVVVEIRHDWKLPIAKGKDLFTIPQISLWKELGFLIFRRLETMGSIEAEAPQDKQVKLGNLPPAGNPPRPRPLNDLLPFQPAKSRSHWYYSVGVDNFPKPLTPEANLDFELSKLSAGESWDGMATVRTKHPLFRYVSPISGDRLTPKDEIIFRLDYLGESYADYQYFLPEHFKVELEFKHSANPSLTGYKKEFQCLPRENDPLGKSVRPFFTSIILDPDPSSKGKMELLGLWDVDITIKAEGGPLKGATRRLIRRQVEITNYPKLIIPSGIVVSNESKTPGRVSIPLELDVRSKPKSNVAYFDLEISEGIGSFEKGAFALDKKNCQWPIGNHLQIVSQGNSWGDKPIGVSQGKIKVRLPWETEPTFIDFVVDKKKYQVAFFQPPILDVTGKKSAEIPILFPAFLDTRFSTFESVILSPYPMLTGNRLTLVNENTKEVLSDLKISGLGKLKIFGGEKPDLPNSGFVIHFSKPLAPGRWVGEAIFSGPSIHPGKTRFEILADQPYLFVENGPGNFEKVHSLGMLGLPGATLNRTLKVQSLLAKEAKVLGVRDMAAPISLDNHSIPKAGFTIKKDEKKGDILHLEGKIPFSIAQGNFQSSLLVELESVAAPILCSFPIFIQGVHHGVHVEPPGVLQLVPPEKNPCTGVSIGSAKVSTKAEKNNPVRWFVSATVVPVGDTQVKWFPWEKLEVFPKGGTQNILNKPDENNKPTRPLEATKADEILVHAQTLGLEAGIYKQVLKFHSYEDFPGAKDGPVFELPIQIVVQGHELQLSPIGSKKPLVGIDQNIQLNVTSFHVPPTDGIVQWVDKNGQPLEGSSPIHVDGAKPTMTKADDRDGKTFRNDYQFKIRPLRAGKNHLQVRWKKECLGTAGNEDYQTKTFTFEVEGKLSVSQRVAYVGESLKVWLPLNPEDVSKGQTTVKIRATPAGGKAPIIFEIFDDGRKQENGDEHANDAIYSGKWFAPDPGHYDLNIEPDSIQIKTEPVPLEVGFELIAAKNLGTILYGAGSFGPLMGARETVDSMAVTLTNRHPGHLKIKARLLYPESSDESKNLLHMDPDAIKGTVHFDESIHLTGSIYSLPNGSGEGNSTEQPETLDLEVTSENPLAIYLKAGLSKEASAQVFQGNGSHSTLNGANGLIIALDMEWRGEDGIPIKRKLKVPVSVSTDSWFVRGALVFLGIIAVCLVGYKGVRGLKKNKRQRPLTKDPLAPMRPTPQPPKDAGSPNAATPTSTQPPTVSPGRRPNYPKNPPRGSKL